jgi:hypothetical protein
VNFPFKTLKNALRNYTQNSCGTNPPSSAAALVAEQYRLREAATAQTFRSDLGKNLDAVAYIGHTSLANFGQPNEFSKGITFYYPLFDQKNPGDESSWDVLYPVSGTNTADILAPECAAPDNFCENQASAYLNKLLPFEKDVTSVVGLGSSWDYRNHAATLAVEPGPPHPPILLVNRISQQAKILFFGACALTPQSALSNEVPVFLQMWDINDARFGVAEARDRAMIVPDGSSIANFDPNTTDLAYAAAMWNRILFNLVSSKMTAQNAVSDANTSITPAWPTRQPKFMVLGNPNVRLK